MCSGSVDKTLGLYFVEELFWVPKLNRLFEEFFRVNIIKRSCVIFEVAVEIIGKGVIFSGVYFIYNFSFEKLKFLLDLFISMAVKVSSDYLSGLSGDILKLFNYVDNNLDEFFVTSILVVIFFCSDDISSYCYLIISL